MAQNWQSLGHSKTEKTCWLPAGDGKSVKAADELDSARPSCVLQLLLEVSLIFGSSRLGWVLNSPFSI
jgi:hypothetical protein